MRSMNPMLILVMVIGKDRLDFYKAQEQLKKSFQSSNAAIWNWSIEDNQKFLAKTNKQVQNQGRRRMENLIWEEVLVV